MKKLLPIILSFSTSILFAQTSFKTIDRLKVEATINDSVGENFYPSLLNKYNDFDTSLSREQYRLLYYGFAFQKDYNGYSDHKKREILQLINDNKFSQAVMLCDSILNKIPISLTANFYKGFALYNISQADPMSIVYRNRYLKLREAILSSGDGLDCTTAFKTIFIPDEYEVVYNYFKVQKVQSQSMKYPCDEIDISPTEMFKATKMFFDTSETIISMQKHLKKK